MLSPTTAIQRPDLGLALEEFDLDASRQGFIGMKLFPVLAVALATANFSRVKLASLLQKSDTKRAPGAGYSRGSGGFTQDNYACQENGHEEVVDDRERKIYAYTIDSELIAAKRTRDVVLRNYEIRVANKCLDTAVFTGNQTAGAIAGWINDSTAKPITDIKNAVTAIYDLFGQRPNVVAMTWDDYKNLRECSQIIDRIKYSGRDDPKNVTRQMLAEIFDVEEVLVGDAKQNSANEGQPAVLGNVWTSGKVFIGKRAATNDLREPCIGRTMHFDADGSSMGGAVEMYRDETVRGDVVRVRMDSDEKVINKELGFLLTGV